MSTQDIGMEFFYETAQNQKKQKHYTIYPHGKEGLRVSLPFRWDTGLDGPTVVEKPN